jgi:hypothetical protein
LVAAGGRDSLSKLHFAKILHPAPPMKCIMEPSDFALNLYFCSCLQFYPGEGQPGQEFLDASMEPLVFAGLSGCYLREILMLGMLPAYEFR